MWAQRPKWKTRILYGSEWGPPFLLYSCVAWCSYRTPNNESRGVSDSFDCFWVPFSPAVLLHLALIWRFVPSLVRPCQWVYPEGLLFFFFDLWESEGGGQGLEEWRKGKLRLACNVWEKKLKKQKEHRKTMGRVWLWPISLKWSLPSLPEKVCHLFLLPPTSCLLSWRHKRLSFL